MITYIAHKMDQDQTAPWKQSDQGSYCLLQWKNLVWIALEFMQPCAYQESCQRGSNSDNVFFQVFFSLMREERIQISLKVDHHQLTSKTPFKWRLAGRPMMAQHQCWLGSFVNFQGIRTSIAKKHYIFVIFQGCPDPLSPHPLWIHAWQQT